MFIRIKNVKNKQGKIYPYAYLVDNKWYKRGTKNKGKGSRQKVTKYLGRVYEFDVLKEEDFFSYNNIENYNEYIKKNNRRKIINDIIKWELYRHAISKDEFEVDYINSKITKNKKKASIKINEGILNSFTWKRLINFKFSGKQREDGINLAKFFVEAGLEVPKEIFIGLFSKIY